MYKAMLNACKALTWEERLIYLYIITLPLLDYFVFTFFNKKVIFADFTFLILSIVLAVKYFPGKIKINLSGLKYPLILLPILFSASFLNSSSRLSSTVELISLVYLMILFLSTVNILDNPKKIRFGLWLYFITSVVLSLIGLVLFSRAVLLGDLRSTSFLGYGTMESMAHHFPRIDLAFESANMALAYLHVSLIIGSIIFLTAKSKQTKLFIVLLSLAIFITAFFTGSRRFTGLLLSLFIIFSWYGRSKIASVLKYLIFTGFLVFFAVSIITSIWVIFPLKVTKDNLSKELGVKANYAYSIHYLLPAVSLKMFKEHPFIGIGFGTFNKNFKDYVDWDWLRSSFGFEAYPDYVELVNKKELNFDPHSVFFGSLAETGLLGFGALVFFLTGYARRLSKRLRSSDSLSFGSILSGCVLAGFIGFMLNALTLDILSMRHFWFMLAIGLAASKVGS